jgi:pyruvate dehydrogenase E2 component (dihydrolipoamide acetyltransferase)/2-oxoisovalerate dehydrogenase E2 component (dihydrolipoyl transacylase)
MDFSLPELGEGLYEAELVRWLVKPGDQVKRGQSLLEVMTDKATMEVPAPFAGAIVSVAGQPGERIKVGDTILSYTPAGGSETVPPAVAKRAEAQAATPALATVPAMAGAPTANGASQVSAAGPVAAPSVRHFARKLGIDLSRIHGSGPGGRILLDDLTAQISRLPSDKPAKKEPEPFEFDVGVPGTRVRLQGLRRKIAEHLVEAKKRIPHYSYIDECDITEMVKLRTALRDPCAARGLKLTYLSFFIKAAAHALKEVPIVNSSLDESTQEIVFHDHYNVGIAVATRGGLVVPVVHDADKKDIYSIAAEVERLGSEAKAGRVKLDDLRGGTFTVTSIGNIGGLISTPIINYPEVGILGVGRVVKRPIYDKDLNIRPADIVYLSFSFDHRVVDGAVGAVFGSAVVKHLQNPATLLLPEKL